MPMFSCALTAWYRVSLCAEKSVAPFSAISQPNAETALPAVYAVELLSANASRMAPPTSENIPAEGFSGSGSYSFVKTE